MFNRDSCLHVSLGHASFKVLSDGIRLWKTKVSVNPGHCRYFATTGQGPKFWNCSGQSGTVGNYSREQKNVNESTVLLGYLFGNVAVRIRQWCGTYSVLSWFACGTVYYLYADGSKFVR